MKKTLGTYFSQYFKMPCLYRDDLEAIEKIVREDLKPDSYNLACNGVEFGRLVDIPPEMRDTHVLVIYTHSPCMRLKFAQSWAELYCGTAGSEVDEAIQEIGRIVSKGERPLLWMFCKYAAWLAPLLGFGSLAIVMGLILLNLLAVQSLYLASWVLGLVSVWWAVGHRYSLHSFSHLDLQRVRGRSRGGRLQQDKVLIFLSGLALGGATVWLLAKYFRWM